MEAARTFERDTTATIQAGRFLLNRGSRRRVAADDYPKTTNGYTGTRTDLAWRGGWKSTALYALPQQRRPDDLPALRRNRVAPDREGFDLVLWGGLLSRSKTIGRATVETAFFHLGERDRPGRPTRDRSLDTGALRIIADPIAGGVDYEVEEIVQRGRISTGLAANAPHWMSPHGSCTVTSATRSMADGNRASLSNTTMQAVIG